MLFLRGAAGMQSVQQPVWWSCWCSPEGWTDWKQNVWCKLIQTGGHSGIPPL